MYIPTKSSIEENNNKHGNGMKGNPFIYAYVVYMFYIQKKKK